jgi:hypothetical protein
MDSVEKIEITPEELAHALFSRIVEDTSTILDSHSERFKSCASFQPNRFERRKFLYLAADMAMALTAASQQQSAMAEVVPHFRHRVVVMMEQHWGDAEADVDAEIEKASADYAKLLFTNPDDHNGFSFDWARDWLTHVGIDETNPAVLLSIASNWRLFHSHTIKSLSLMRVVSAKAGEGRTSAPSLPSIGVAASILALCAAKWWESQLDPSERLEQLNRMYWRLKGRRYRPLREIEDHRDIARCLEPLISEFFAPKVVSDWFQKKPDPEDEHRMEAWQQEALDITMRFDPFPDEPT